jgi:prophage antirepressor-like protein
MSSLTKSNNNNKLIQVKTERFFDKDIHVLSYHGNDFFIANEVAEALEYNDPRNMTKKILDDWSDEFIEGTDYVFIEGEELNDLRLNFERGESPRANFAALNQCLDLIPSKARSLTLLSEQGIQLVCLKSKTQKAKDFRRWVIEVLSNMRKGIQPQVVSQTQDDRESRLREKQATAKQKLEEDTAKRKAKALFALAKDFQGRYPDKVLDTLKIRATEIATGEKLTHLLAPQAPKGIWFQAEDIAKEVGTTASNVGKMASKIGLKDTDKVEKRLQTIEINGGPRTVPLFLYNEDAKNELLLAFENKPTKGSGKKVLN